MGQPAGDIDPQHQRLAALLTLAAQPAVACPIEKAIELGPERGQIARKGLLVIAIDPLEQLRHPIRVQRPLVDQVPIVTD